MKEEKAQKILKETKENFNLLAEEFSITRQYPWKILTCFAEYLKEGKKVLDLGCGNGRLYGVLKNKSIKYVGIDNSEKLIEIAKNKVKSPAKGEARQRRQKSKVKNISQNFEPQFLVAEALNLPFKDEEFDHVFMIAVLPHLPGKELQEKVLKEVIRVLKKEGNIFITCWNLWQPKYLWKNLKNRAQNPNLYQGLSWRDFFIPWHLRSGQMIQRFYYAFSKKELKNLLKKVGFQIEKIYYEFHGKKSHWWKGFNLVVIAKKDQK